MNFRRWFTVLSVLVLFVGLASAQTGNPLSCSANTTSTPTIRGEGYTELIGDIVLTCTGGSIAAGAAIPQVNITVAMNQSLPVTSRLLTASGTTQPAVGKLSDAVLFVDDPGAMNGLLTGYGPNAPQIVCTTPTTGCGGFAATSGAYIVPVKTAGTVPATQEVANVFQGIVNGNQVTFNGVPVLPPGTTASRTFRITNVRINATSLYQPSANLITVSANISTNPSMYLPLSIAQPVVAYATRGLDGASKTTSTLTQCASAPSDSPTQTATITFQEQFQTAFKTRISPLSGVPSYGITDAQYVPGGIYNTESGVTIGSHATGSFQGIGSGLTPGLASYPTRIKATFYNIPVGISGIYVDSTPVGVTNPTPGDTSTVAYAQLLTSETADPGAYVTTAKAPLVISNGTATAVWEITNANANAFDTLKFNVYVSYTPDSVNNRPSGTAQVVLSYAPTYDPASAAASASASLPIPRFATFLAPKDVMTVIPCQTVLLWPYVTTFTGFNTGIAISNTSKDPGKNVIGGAGTTAQAGTCALYLYGAAEFSNVTAPTLPLTTPRIEAGTTYSFDLAGLLGSYSVSTGYMFAVCNFQYAHGYAAISDVHFDKFLSSYLALVVNDTSTGTAPVTRGVAAENFNQ